jgi:hypothetical protein
MATWTNKQWWALIAGLAAYLVFLIGFEETAVVALFAIAGYFVGKYLDGEIDLEVVRARAQGRARGRDPAESGARAQESPYAPPPVASGAGSPSRSTPPRVR